MGREKPDQSEEGVKELHALWSGVPHTYFLPLPEANLGWQDTK